MAWTREQMAERAARELKDGFYANLSIGIPTLVGQLLNSALRKRRGSKNTSPP